MMAKQSNTFTFEQKLLTSADDDKELEKRFFHAFRIHNQLVRHAKKQVDKYYADIRVRELLDSIRELREVKSSSKEVSALRKEFNRELSALRLEYGLTQYQFKLWAAPMQHAVKAHIDSRTVQCIADDVWTAVSRYLFSNGRRIHFAKSEQISSIESNDNKTGIMFRNGCIRWNGLNIRIRRDKGNPYEEEALKHRVKYCRIVRKPVGSRYHYYAQLVLEGTPPQKHQPVSGRVGMDPGTMSVAVVSENKAMLLALDEGVPDHSGEIRSLQRKLDRSRRSMNPECFNEDGTVKKKPKRWKTSHNYNLTLMRKRSVERKRADSLKQHHERLANDILSLGNEIYTEAMNYKALQRRKKETTRTAEGRFARKKRFGASLKNGAPSMLLSIIDRKLGYMDRFLIKVDTASFRASQYNHITDEYIKKSLSKRNNTIDGKWIQRDLYSAFLLKNSDDSLKHTDRAMCTATYESFLAAHDECISELISGKHKALSSFGLKSIA